MKKFTILFIVCLYCSQIYAQQCIKIKNELIYIEFEIFRKENYPIFMAGVSKSFDINSISKINDSLFIKTFYERCSYVPDIELTSQKVANLCSESISNDQLKKKIAKLIRRINNKSSNFVIKLDNGSIVSINICTVEGIFLVIDNVNMFTSSYHYPVDNISPQCYLPYDIKQVKKMP